MSFDEDNYEDELDRMRARKQKKKSGHVPAPREVDDDDFLFYNDVDEMGADQEFDLDDDEDDYHFEYSKDDYEEEPAPVRTVKAGRQSGRRAAGVRKKRRKKTGFLKILLLVVVLLAGYLAFKHVSDDGYWTIAVFGVDSRDGSLGKGALSDVEMICSIDKKTGEIRLVSVFRDSYLRIDNDDTYHKINEAYFKGGHQQAVEALEQNLDIKIDDYATFNWKAVVDAINVLDRKSVV